MQKEGGKVREDDGNFDFVPGLVIYGHQWYFVASVIADDGRSASNPSTLYGLLRDAQANNSRLMRSRPL